MEIQLGWERVNQLRGHSQGRARGVQGGGRGCGENCPRVNLLGTTWKLECRKPECKYLQLRLIVLCTDQKANSKGSLLPIERTCKEESLGQRD
jgi:hypothetical protein